MRGNRSARDSHCEAPWLLIQPHVVYACNADTYYIQCGCSVSVVIAAGPQFYADPCVRSCWLVSTHFRQTKNAHALAVVTHKRMQQTENYGTCSVSLSNRHAHMQRFLSCYLWQCVCVCVCAHLHAIPHVEHGAWMWNQSHAAAFPAATISTANRTIWPDSLSATRRIKSNTDRIKRIQNQHSLVFVWSIDRCNIQADAVCVCLCGSMLWTSTRSSRYEVLMNRNSMPIRMYRPEQVDYQQKKKRSQFMVQCFGFSQATNILDEN